MKDSTQLGKIANLESATKYAEKVVLNLKQKQVKSIFQYTGNYKFRQKGTEKKKVRSTYEHKNTKTTNVRSCYVGTKHQKSAQCQFEVAFLFIHPRVVSTAIIVKFTFFKP